MNDNFSFARLWLYAKRHYVENRKLYINLPIMVLIYSYLSLISYKIVGNTTMYVNSMEIDTKFTSNYMFTLFVIISLITNMSIKYIKKASNSSNHYKLPMLASERYLFVVLNSLLVSFIISAATYSIANPLARLQYYKAPIAERYDVSAGNNETYVYAQKSLLGDLHNEELYTPADDVITLGEIFKYEWLFGLKERNFANTVLFIGIAFVPFLVIMFGVLTFRRSSIIKSVLLHLAVGLVVSYFQFNVIKQQVQERVLANQDNISPPDVTEIVDNAMMAYAIVILIVICAYMYYFYYRMKNRQIY